MESKISKKKIIFVRNSFPYKGGSSTILYLLFQAMQRHLPNAEYWNLITERDRDIGIKHYGPAWSNPKGLKNVKTFLLDGNIKKQKIKNALAEAQAEVILSKSRISTELLKTLRPNVEMWHLTSTSGAIKNAIAGGYYSSMQDAIRKIKNHNLPRAYYSEEHTAIRHADRVLFHSATMKLWYYNFYPEFREKMGDEVFWDYTILQKHLEEPEVTNHNWDKRPVDLMFVASDWDRPEKNFTLMQKICNHFKRRKISAVGFLPQSLPKNVIAFNTMTHGDLMQAMQNTKVVVSPSRYDEAPNILFEGAINGCNIVCSKNCGNYRLVPEDFIADLNMRDFARKIKKALVQKKELNKKYFFKNDLGEWILNQLSRKEDVFLPALLGNQQKDVEKRPETACLF